ncbi:MAG: nucleotide exchange factor GrpE [Myxococcota bacterium]|nr:nucleotide exchange factor GrpE [Myxococcota bacterium]
MAETNSEDKGQDVSTDEVVDSQAASNQSEDPIDNMIDFGDAAAGGDSDQSDEEPDPIASLQREVEDWRGRAYRHAADLDNARRRFNRERDELKKFGVEGLLRDMLPVVDNLERALAHAESGHSMVEGVELVLRQFVQVASQYGAKPFDASGESFDPQRHEAMSQIPMPDVEPGTVVEVFQRGWMLHDRLVRPAMVVVAAAPPTVESDDGEAESDKNPDVKLDQSATEGDNGE